jgi:LmbE family N-acetylglucosaminyl deacetylase
MDDRHSRCFVVSPHLDDAVFSCGMLLATHPGSVVCTVFAGEPPTRQSTTWDRASGFADSHEAMCARQWEDHRALALCGAYAVHLPFLDSQYASSPASADVAQALAHAWQQSGINRLVVPLGLYHTDHLTTGEAWRLLLREQRLAVCVAYEDALYRTRRGIVDAKRESLADAGVHLQPLADGALGDGAPYDLAAPERFWQVAA